MDTNIETTLARVLAVWAHRVRLALVMAQHEMHELRQWVSP
jgi:hypothetical protein